MIVDVVLVFRVEMGKGVLHQKCARGVTPEMGKGVLHQRWARGCYTRDGQGGVTPKMGKGVLH